MVAPTLVRLLLMTLALAGALPVHAAEAAPRYYLRGFYLLSSQRPVWTTSDESAWAQAKTAESWVDPRLVKWGYLPFTHDAQHFYCMIEHGPRTGSHVMDTTFLCGDAATTAWLFQTRRRPVLPTIGGGPPLEPSLRPEPPGL